MLACDCGRCTTATASGAQCLIAGIAGQAEHAVLGMAAQSPLGDVRFADHDATCARAFAAHEGRRCEGM